MVLVSEKLNPKACTEFEADIYLLYHANKISKGFQVTLHVGNVCQTVIIVSMDQVYLFLKFKLIIYNKLLIMTFKEFIKTNEKAKVKFRFQSRPEYITVGSRFIFREGRCKGLGEITKVISPFDYSTALDSTESMVP